MVWWRHNVEHLEQQSIGKLASAFTDFRLRRVYLAKAFEGNVERLELSS